MTNQDQNIDKVRQKVKQNTTKSEPLKWYFLMPKDFFEQTEIKHILRQPRGRHKVYIYQRLLCLGTSKSGLLLISENVPFTEKDIADEINEKLPIVRETLYLLEELGLLERVKISEDKELIYLTEVAKMQQSRKDTANNRRKIRQTEKEKQAAADEELNNIINLASRGLKSI